MTTNSRFRRGTGCYTCSSCGKRTRNTGDQSLGSTLCPRCWEESGDENMVQDGMMTQAEFDVKWRSGSKNEEDLS